MNKEWKSYYGPAKQADLNNAERIIGYPLPSAFKEIILSYDAACMVGDPSFRYNENNSVSGLGIFLSFTHTEEVNSFIEEQLLHQKRKWLPSGVIAFSQTGCGNYLCFDYRGNNNEPSIVIYHINAEHPSPEEIMPVAPNFKALLDILYFDEN